MEERKEVLQKEVLLIQEIIKRMASNSFMIKGWTITLIVATLLLKGNSNQIFIGYIPLIAFWFLDAFYLQQERMYRKLYEWVINNRMQYDEYCYDMSAKRFKKNVDSKFRTMFSSTLAWFYIPLFFIFIIYSLIIYLANCKG